MVGGESDPAPVVHLCDVPGVAWRSVDGDGEDDTPSWLQSAAADVGVAFGVSPANVRGGTVADRSVADRSFADCSVECSSSSTPSPPTPMRADNVAGGASAPPKVALARAASPKPPLTDAGEPPEAAVVLSMPLRTPQLPLATSELVRRARRRLAMVASAQVVATRATEQTQSSAARPAETEAEAEEGDEELLGRVYFLRTRLSGRRLLRAWSAWRKGSLRG